LYHKDKALKRC